MSTNTEPVCHLLRATEDTLGNQWDMPDTQETRVRAAVSINSTRMLENRMLLSDRLVLRRVNEKTSDNSHI